MAAYQGSEVERASLVVTHEPGLEGVLGFLHPLGSLYEQPYPPDRSTADHRGYQETLRRHGCQVHTLCDVLAEGAERPEPGQEPSAQRKALLELAASRLEYRLEGARGLQLPEKTSRALAEDYKREALAQYSAEDLARVVLLGPVVELKPSGRNTGLVTRSVSLHSAQNLVFTRDQQITTRKGVVLGNFSAPQRLCESRIMRFCWEKLGFAPVGDIGGQNAAQEAELGLAHGASSLGAGHRALEGGDFIAASPSLAACGCGLRSTYPSMLTLMDQDLLGTARFIVVNDPFDQNQDRMHLDCIFSPLHDKLVVLDEYVMRGAGRRYVDEWHREGGSYRLRRASVEFVQWLTENGYSIIPLKHEFQLAYGCNMLNLGTRQVDGREKTVVLGVHEESAKAIASSPVFQEYCQKAGCEIELVYVSFRGITSMYGSLHCASQVVQRVPCQKRTEAAEAEAARALAAYPGPAEVDCMLYVPACASEQINAYCSAYAPETAPADIKAKILDEVHALYESLLSQGRRVYPWFQSAFAPLVSLREALSPAPQSLEDAIRRLSSPGGAGKPLRGANTGSTWCEKVLGLTDADLLYNFSK